MFDSRIKHLIEGVDIDRPRNAIALSHALHNLLETSIFSLNLFQTPNPIPTGFSRFFPLISVGP